MPDPKKRTEDSIDSVTDNQTDKKRKLDNPERLQCEFFLAKKNRRCAMTRKAANKYCAEHMNSVSSSEGDSTEKSDTGKRIPCPIDGRHTIWERDLLRHTNKCNSIKQVNDSPWYIEDCNVNGNMQDFDREEEGESFYQSVIGLVNKATESMEKLKLFIESHDSLNPRLKQLQNKKHAIQQSSLIGHLLRLGLLDPDTNILEFGCGKAELSRFVNLALLDQYQSSCKNYGFIDRGVNRMKMDHKIRQDCADNKVVIPNIRRTRIDIKDLNLDNFLDDLDPVKSIAISKHLCGAATDLTLQCLLNSKRLMNENFFAGSVVAMCCRHCCSYDKLLPESRQFLNEKGIDSNSFKTLTKMATWAVCGRREGMKDESINGHVSGLTVKEREEVGLRARRLIDESRIWALKDKFEVEMFLYVNSSTSLENVCLTLRPKKN